MDIGVCTWCIDRDKPDRGITVAGLELGLRVVQIGFFSRAAVAETNAGRLREKLAAANVRLAGAFLGFADEDYASIERIAATGGFLPDETFQERMAIAEQVADLAADLECQRVGVHIGTIPEDQSSREYEKLVARTGSLAEAFGRRGLRLLLETGREPMDALLGLMDAVDSNHLGVSFDPANLVIYSTDDPVQAVRKLRERIELVHIKDARRSPRPGVEFGGQAAIGTGDVEIPRVLSKLRATGYDGPLLIETKADGADLSSIRGAANYLRTMVA